MNIERGIPPPTGRKQLRDKYGLQSLEIGDCVTLEPAERELARQNAAQYKRRFPGWDYTYRTLNDGRGRIWRTA